MVRWLPLALLVACSGGTGKDDSALPSGGTPGGTPSGGTGTGTGTGSTIPVNAEVSCVPTDHAQVFRCTATADQAGSAVWRWEPVDGQGPAREATDEAVGETHETLIWGLKADTGYTVELTHEGAAPVSTSVTAGSLPPELEGVVSASGSATLDQVLIPLHCTPEPAVVMVDRDGDIVWHHTYGLLNLTITAFHWTERGTVLAMVGGEFIREHSLDDRELLALRRGTDFDQPVHHDIFGAADGRSYMLFGELFALPEGDYVLDGVYTFDETGVLDTWHLADHLPIDTGWTGYGTSFWSGVWPGSIDYSHGNALEVEEDGDWTMSFRMLDLVMRVDGDSASPTFGEPLWTLTGEASSPVASDLGITSSGGVTGDLDFSGQHNANLSPSGQLLLFDNRWQLTGNSRMLVFDIDQGAGTADIVEAYDLGEQCSIQGGAYELPTGNHVATCGAPEVTTAWEFVPGQPDPIWTMPVSCPNWRGTLNRAMPVVWDGPLAVE